MPRPRKDQVGENAKERIERAFWELLEEMPYRSISVRALSERAGVNHNTFYYHFGSIKDLALRMVTDNVPNEFFEVVATIFDGGDLDVDHYSHVPGLQQRFDRFRLILRNGDGYLIEVGKRRLIERLVEYSGVDSQILSSYDYAKLQFFIGGVASVLSSGEIETFQQYLELMQDGLAHTAVDILNQVLRPERGADWESVR